MLLLSPDCHSLHQGTQCVPHTCNFWGVTSEAGEVADPSHLFPKALPIIIFPFHQILLEQVLLVVLCCSVVLSPQHQRLPH